MAEQRSSTGRQAAQNTGKDRIEVGIDTDAAETRNAIEENREYVMGETLATILAFGTLPDADGVEHDVAGQQLTLFVRVVDR